MDSDFEPQNSNSKSKGKGKARQIEEDSDDDSDLDLEIDGLDSEDELLLSNNPRNNLNLSNKKRKTNNNNSSKQAVNGKKKGSGKSGGLGKSKDQGYAWEATFKRSWEAVQEDEGGSLANSVKKLLEGNRRNRTLQDSSPVQRGIIRHLVLVLDLSEAMNEKDLRPNRHELTLSYASAFVTEYFDQNPIGQLSILGTRSGVAERLLPMGGNAVEALQILSSKRKLTPKGEPSLQNSLEMARSSLSHLPISNTREILFLFGSLTTCDPSNIHETLENLIKDKIRVSIICLSAEIKICKEISNKTDGKFGVVLNEDHFRELIMGNVNPLEIEDKSKSYSFKKKENRRNEHLNGEDDDDENTGIDLMQMGFPLQLSTTSTTSKATNSLCSCHSKFRSLGYLCPRCGIKVCQIPTDCSVCDLTIVLSTHLARSYHHLFPVGNWRGVAWDSLNIDSSPSCFGCASPFPKQPTSNGRSRNSSNNPNRNQPQPQEGEEEISQTGRYRCRKCGEDFCLDCDTFTHEVLFSCPGCC